MYPGCVPGPGSAPSHPALCTLVYPALGTPLLPCCSWSYSAVSTLPLSDGEESPVKDLPVLYLREPSFRHLLPEVVPLPRGFFPGWEGREREESGNDWKDPGRIAH